MDKLAKEPGFICSPTNLKLIEEGGEAYSRGALIWCLALAGGRLFERGCLFEEIRYSPI